MRRPLLCVLAVLIAGAALPAQQADQPELQRRRAEKVQKEVFGRAPWKFDFDAARAAAKESGKLIFAYFTRSYAH
ncbi:MAG: hypothetical protein AB7O97_14370 [Planctomycetota bacterium]